MTAAALGYTSVPTGLELEGPEVEAQRGAIERACEQLGLRLVELVGEHQPDSPDSDGQPGLLRTLDRIELGEASCLVVSELEHLGRRVRPLAAVLDRLEKGGAVLVALNVGLDTATESGRLAVARRPPSASPEPAAKSDPVAPEPEPVDKEPLLVDAAEPLSVDAAEPLAVDVAPRPEPAAPAPPPPSPEPPAAPPTEPIQDAGTAVRALGYASIAADADGGPRAIHAQQHEIERRCRELGLELVDVVREREPKTGRALDRAGLSFLIERVAAGVASCVIVTGLERLSHSVAELGTIMQWLEQNRVRLVVVELDLDTSTPGGHITARTLASVAGWEHERMSERTRKGLAAARAMRHAGAGTAAPDFAVIRKRIATMRADGMTLQAIADALNAEGVPTQRGAAQWRPSSVQTAAGYKRRTRATQVSDLPNVQGRGPLGP